MGSVLTKHLQFSPICSVLGRKCLRKARRSAADMRSVLMVHLRAKCREAVKECVDANVADCASGNAVVNLRPRAHSRVR